LKGSIVQAYRMHHTLDTNKNYTPFDPYFKKKLIFYVYRIINVFYCKYKLDK